MKPRIFVSTSSFGEVSERPLQMLADAGYDVALNPHGRKLTEAEVSTLVEGCVGLVAGTEPLTRAVLTSLSPALRAISRVGVGVDKIDHQAARELGIGVRNTPSAHVNPVAELTLAGLLDCCRHVSQADRRLRGGTWRKPMGQLLRGKRVGLLGYGQVARSLHALLKPFDVTVFTCDPALDVEGAAAAGVELVSLDDLFASVDFVSIHLPGGEATRGLVGRDLLDRLPPRAIFLNTARGDVVDEVGLAAWLTERPHAFAYLDVFAKEPYSGPLAGLDNVVLTPHIGSYAREGRAQMETEAVDNLLAMLGSS